MDIPHFPTPVRFALAGCGKISERHFSSIQNLGLKGKLVGICEQNQARLETAQAKLGVPGFVRYQEFLEALKGKADVIVLATPSGLHASQAIRAAEMGFHVISEKPMATRWQDGQAMVEAFDRAEKNLFVVKQNRLNPTIQRLKQALDSKRFGRIYMVNVNVFWNRPQAYYDSEPWRGTWELDGGAIMNQASHYVDLLDWLIGPVDTVHAFTSTLARNIQVEDTGVVSLQWRSGALGSLNVTMLTFPKNLEGSITVLGENGTARIGGSALNKVEHWEFSEPLQIDREISSASYESPSVYGNGHQLYYQNVLRSLTLGEPIETDGRMGLRSLELLIAIYLSARDRQRVALPLDLR